MGNSAAISIPGKVFLIGEYAVLAGLPAWVAAVPPRFTFRSTPGVRPGFHSESPAGKLLTKDFEGEFTDPWNGLGGFGRSTAEFAAAAYFLGMREPLEVWDHYQEMHKSVSGIPPSGADLIAQWCGGVIQWEPSKREVLDLTSEIADMPILLFSATHLDSRKTVTHSHLGALGILRSKDQLFIELRNVLSPVLSRASAGLAEKNPFEVGRSFSSYAEALASLGLEADFVKREREALARIPGVLGVKGCGALQTDAMLVMVDSLENGRRVDAIIEYAEREFGLKLLSRGLSAERGIG